MLGLYVPVVLYGLLHLVFADTRYSSALQSAGSGSSVDVEKLKLFVFSSCFYLTALNFISPHQEYRFLMPVLPSLHLLCGYAYSCIHTDKVKLRESKVYTVSVNDKYRQYSPNKRIDSFMYSIFIMNIILAVYLSRRHQVFVHISLTFRQSYVTQCYCDVCRLALKRQHYS